MGSGEGDGHLEVGASEKEKQGEKDGSKVLVSGNEN